MYRNRFAAVLLTALTAFAGSAYAAPMTHAHDLPPAAIIAPEALSTQEYRAAMDKMHADMAIGYSNDADVDFARGMIPHHQAAIDMAQTQLKYGKDPVLRKMSNDIIKAQQAEIKQLQNWLRQHEK